jgi:fermentation-respiration switch protein FrsA (DUF1100 family)
MNIETERSSHRWYHQKWIFDTLVGLMGPEVFASGGVGRSFGTVGPEAAQDGQAFRSRVKRFSDITREARRLAARREAVAKDAESKKHLVTARNNYFAASLFYGAARWPIWEHNAELLECNIKLATCYQKYAEFAPHPVERVRIPFEGHTLYGYLHLPSRDAKRFPTILSVQGMDSFKEQGTPLYGDKLLERGFAVLNIDGPGQGETLVEGLKVTPDNFDRAGRAAMDFLRNRRDVLPDAIGLIGTSFGTYWGPRILAYDKRFRLGTLHSTCHEPGMRTLFSSAFPFFKLRHMFMAGYDDEEEFDSEYAAKLTLKGIGPRIKCPVFIAGGEGDQLSPVQYAIEFYKSLGGPRRLVIYEGEPHVMADPNLHHNMGDFMLDVLAGRAVASGMTIVEPGGVRREVKDD